jgi:hypothetical protein
MVLLAALHTRNAGNEFAHRAGLLLVGAITASPPAAPREVLAELAFHPDLPDFRGHAAELVAQGLTTPEEAYRVLATSG